MTQGQPPDSRRTRKKEAFQLRIIDVALQVFAQQGFEHATMEAIADEALQRGALFSAYLRFRMQHLQDDELDEQLRSGLHLHIQRHPGRIDAKNAIGGVVELYLRGAGNAH